MTLLAEARADYDEAAERYIQALAAGRVEKGMQRAAVRAWAAYQHLRFQEFNDAMGAGS